VWARNNMLFKHGNFTSHAGKALSWKIDCDALTDDDWGCAANLIGRTYQFKRVVGIPTGGLKLAKLLEPYCDPKNAWKTLIVDDVFTTGKSMEDMKNSLGSPISCRGVVLFARGKLPSWIDAIFTVGEDFR
jgi:orotate phosphoribosyltransferase